MKIPMIVCLLLLAACSRQEPATAAPEAAAASAKDARGASTRTPASRALNDPIDRIDLPAAAPAGSGIGPLSAKTLALTPAMVERAIIAELADGATGIDVSVDRGFVRLSGDVRSEADFQRANYVARAIDGVIEVDQSQMRVAR